MPSGLRRRAVAAVLAAAFLLISSGPASAHPALVTSSPGAGYAVVDAPRAIALTFNEPVTLPDRPLVVRDARGARLDLALTTQQAGSVLVGTPSTPLRAGAYEVAYRVVGQDGDLISGTFGFGVATPVGTAGASVPGGSVSGAPESVPVGTTMLRALLFLGLALALGGGFLAWRVDHATGGLPGVRPLLRSGSVVALLAVLGLLAGVSGAEDVLVSATTSGVGRLLGLQVLLLAAAAVFARRPARGLLCALMLVLVAALEGLRAHPGEATGALGSALTVSHLLAGALWLGGLVHLLRLVRSWRGRPKAVRVAAHTYARNALVLFALVAATGTVSAVTLLPDGEDWAGTTYGRLLTGKIVAFLVVMGLAVAARARLRRSRPRAESEAQVPAPRPVGRAAAAESAVLATVVLVAAAVTTVTPARLVPVSSLLPAPVGPAVRVAERAQQVSVFTVASKGRVELRADTPDDGEPSAISLVAQVTTDLAVQRPLQLTRCGAACWTAPVDWRVGTNTLTLDVDAQRYEGGRVTVPVSWPAVPAPLLVARVQAAMGARTVIDTVETVTSGFGTVLPHRSRRTGQDFLAGQPWAQGGATDPVVVVDGAGRTLLFALPAQAYHFAMRLDAQDRIGSERIVTPNHLLTREYRYP